ncbi:MarR family transcriptional regulator [Levilactobacillus brevis]|uniref:MarR family transcriptional regulator n=1 Tax=Levilactobacillus brevis TaxID=1580 RepID=A0A2A3TTW8_LEVBR|nr:MarR family transcriptional regulator [Levilactobacillus brevis]PBQ23603.1 MarR family transcriptional regulator [Levilactobacillus brevis]
MISSANAKNLMACISQLLTQDTTVDQEKKWMLSQVATDTALTATIKALRTADFHTIAAISTLTPAYLKSLPEKTGLSQPTISRMMTRLSHHDLVEKYRTVTNSKDILVRLTPKGTQIAEIHAQLDQRTLNNVAQVLEPYSQTEVTTTIQILQEIAKIDVNR